MNCFLGSLDFFKPIRHGASFVDVQLIFDSFIEALCGVQLLGSEVTFVPAISQKVKGIRATVRQMAGYARKQKASSLGIAAQFYQGLRQLELAVIFVIDRLRVGGGEVEGCELLDPKAFTGLESGL